MFAPTVGNGGRFLFCNPAPAVTLGHVGTVFEIRASRRPWANRRRPNRPARPVHSRGPLIARASPVRRASMTSAVV